MTEKWRDWEWVLLRTEIAAMGWRKDWDALGKLLNRHPDDCKRKWASMLRKRNQQEKSREPH